MTTMRATRRETSGHSRGMLRISAHTLLEQASRAGLRVKLLPSDGEVYVLAESQARCGKERGMRRRKLKACWKRLGELARQAPPRDQLLERLGAAKDRAGRIAKNLVVIAVSPEGALIYRLDRVALRTARSREGRYLLRTNLAADDPDLIWLCYTKGWRLSDLRNRDFDHGFH